VTGARVKICGTCTEADLDASVAAGADALGFVVEYPDPVPWNLTRDRALTLMARVPPFVSTVLVTTGSPADVADLVSATMPDVVQLHGDESPTDVDRTVSALPDSVATLAAVGVDVDQPLRRQRATIGEFAASSADGIVLDAEATDRRGGGTGRTVPWERASRLVASASVPVVLAGGLTPENVAEAVETVSPYAVDVISGVERERGSKSPEKLRRFVHAVRTTHE
jgi:phosphoribosylanthranilate isomerase